LLLRLKQECGALSIKAVRPKYYHCKFGTQSEVEAACAVLDAAPSVAAKQKKVVPSPPNLLLYQMPRGCILDAQALIQVSHEPKPQG
jgi:hypothetical protein